MTVQSGCLICARRRKTNRIEMIAAGVVLLNEYSSMMIYTRVYLLYLWTLWFIREVYTKEYPVLLLFDQNAWAMDQNMHVECMIDSDEY